LAGACGTEPDPEKRSPAPLLIALRWATRLGLLLLVGCALQACTAAAPACSHNWVGPAGGSFGIAANWDQNGVPGPSAAPCAPAGSSIVIDGTQSVGRFVSDGAVTIPSGAELQVSGGAQSRIRQLDLAGGTLGGPGSATVSSGSWAGGTITIGGTLSVTGAVTVTADVAVANAVDNAGTFSIDGATTLDIDRLAAPTGSFVLNSSAATLRFAGGSASVDLSGVTVRGGGRIANPVTGSVVLDPAASVGPLRIDGDWTSSGGSALKAAVRNTTTSGHDELMVVGTARPSGATLDVTFDPSYTAATGHSFALLSATGPVMGTFAATQLPAVAGHGVYLAREPSAVRLWVTDCDPATLHPGATLAGGNLSGKLLRGCDLAGSTLVGADLTSADLTDASLRYANLSASVLTGVVWANTTCPDGTNSDANGGTCVGHLPLVLTVNTANDAVDVAPGDGTCLAATPATCSLRAAVQEANAFPGKDIINLPSKGNLKLTRAGVGENASLTGDLDVTGDLVLVGNGATVDANGIDKAFQVLAGASLTADHLVVTKANGTGGAAAFDNVSGTLDLTNVSVNSTTVGVLSAGTTTVRASTIAGASNSGIWTSAGATTIMASTVSGSGQTSGAVFSAGGTTTIVDSTVTLSTGVGLRHTGGTMSAQNSIAANQAPGKPDCSGAIASAGYNLVSDTTCAFAAGGDSRVTDAQLFALTSAGGTIETHLPKQGSPAIDTGMPGCAATDERGLPRNTDGNNDSLAACDRGAVEAGAWDPLTIQVTSTVDAVDANLADGICRTAAGDCTLRAAVQESNVTSGPDVIELAPAAVYDLTIKKTSYAPGAADAEDGSATGDLDIIGALTLHGNGATITNSFDGDLDMAGTSAVSLDHLVLDRGWYGPAIWNRTAPVALDRVVAIGNSSIENNASMALVESQIDIYFETDGTVDADRSTFAKGIWGSGSITVDHTTVSYGIVTTAPATNVVVRDSTVFASGALSPFDNAINHSAGGTVTVTNSILDTFDPSRTACSSPIASGGYNIAPDASCGLSGAADIQNTNPHIGPLAANGGPTRTMLLQTTSAAIDTGRPGCDPVDQRGLTAPSDGDGDGDAACDRGATELAAWSPLAITVNDSADAVDANPGDGVCQTATVGHCTVRAAVQEASASTGPDTIDLQSGVRYALTLPPDGDPSKDTGDLDVATDLVIRGHGATIDSYGYGLNDPAIEAHGAHLELEELTITADSSQEGLLTNAGTGITLRRAVAQVESDGPLVAIDSTVSGRFANTVTVRRSSVGGNSSFGGPTVIEDSLFPNATMVTFGRGPSVIRGTTSYTQSNNQSFSVSGSLSIVDSTLFNTFGFGSPAILTQYPGASITLSNSILFAPEGSVKPLCATPVISGGHNLSSDASCGLTGPGDLQSTQPKLSPLVPHGSGLPTFLPLTGSPAIDTGDAACGSTDGRGQPRPLDGDGDGIATCDRGAVEVSTWNPLGLSPSTTLDKVDANPGDGVCQTNVVGECSLRAAIQEANANTGPDTITLAPMATYKLTIAGAAEDAGAQGDLDVLTGLTINGRGATIDVNSLDNGLQVFASSMTIDDLRIDTVRAQSAAIQSTGDLTLSHLVLGNAPNVVGGGINAAAALRLSDSTLTGMGSRVVVEASATIDRVLFDNGASVATGENASVIVQSSTFVANSLGFSNLVDNSGVLSIVDSTLVGDPSAVPLRNRPGGSISVTNSILQVIDTTGACVGSGIVSGGYNLVTDGRCNFSGPGDLVSTAMRLGKLANYGGTSAVVVPVTGSPAIDSGRPGCSGVDQRGLPRPTDGDGDAVAVCDRGAAEIPPWHPLDLSVTSALDKADAAPGDGVCETMTPGECTLRAAVQEANASTGPDVISLVPATTYLLTIAGTGEDFGATGDLDVLSGVTLHGNGATIDASNLDHGVSVNIATLTLEDVHLVRGAGSTVDNSGGTLVLSHATVSGSQTSVTSTGQLTIQDSSLTSTATAIVSTGTTAVTRSTATSPYRCATLRAPATITASTLAGCREGVSIEGGLASDVVTVTSSTLSQGTSTSAGFGISVGAGRLVVVDSTLVGARGPALRGWNTESTITNSIIQNQPGQGANCATTIPSGGYNLVSDASCGFAAAGDLQSTTANLGPLAANGGPTQTHLPLSGSPAIDTGNPACSPTDQRGVARPQGGQCDRGAVEQ
jgi:CSLREA domain-containing protein